MSNLEKIILRVPRGSKIGPDQRPIYGYAETEAFAKGGLCVHRRFDKRDNPKCPWIISHVNSGMRLGLAGGRTKADAIAVMQKILPAADWNMGESEIIKALASDRRIMDSIREYVRA